jgi:hypothetical protein
VTEDAAHAAEHSALGAARGFARIAAAGNRGLSETRAEAFFRIESAERKKQAAFLRDLYGDSFRPVQVDPGWLRWHDKVIVHMTHAIYDGRRFQDLPILADALEEAGCTDPEILGHCRGQREHVRGCWVVDLILEKE